MSEWDLPASDGVYEPATQETQGIDFDAVRLANPIVDVIGGVVALRRSGREHKGLCPFHQERSPSFTVYADRAHCFGCGWDGDVIQFIEDIENTDTRGAVDILTGGKPPRMTPELKQRIATQKRKREEGHVLRIAEGRLAAQRRWDAASVLGDRPNGYLVKKGVEGHPALRHEGDNLLIPILDHEGEVQSVQSITPDSKKRFHPGAPVKAGRFYIGVSFGRVVLCEGFATGASIYEATAEKVCVAFSKSNIGVIAKEFHEEGIPFVIAADTGAVAEMQDVARTTGQPLVVSPEAGSDFNDQHQERGIDSVRATFTEAMRAYAAEAESHREPEDTDPVDLWQIQEPPHLPRGLLPKVIEDFAFVQAEVMGADPGGLAMAALACAGSMIDDAICLKVKRHERWTESARIWVSLVGGPSVLKTPVMRVAGGHIASIDTTRVIEYNIAKQRWSNDKADGMKTDPPAPPERLRINDTTIEAAQEILKSTSRGILCVQDELAGWFASMEGKGKGGDNSFWLQAFNGGAFSVDRVGRGSVPIENLSVSLIGGIQPDKIRSVMHNSADDGMMQRFFPIVLREGGYDEDIETPDVRQAYDALLDRLYAMKPPRAFLGDMQLIFSDEAQEYRNGLANRHVDMVRAIAHANGKIASHVGKYNGLFARLCVTWHCIENVGADILPQEVSMDTARKVGEFLHGFLFDHLKAFYIGVLGMSDDMEAVRDLAGHILAHAKTSVTPVTLRRSTRLLKTLDRFQSSKLFEQLEALGWLVQTNKRSDSPSWDVNPRVHEIYAQKGRDEKARRQAITEAMQNILGPKT